MRQYFPFLFFFLRFIFVYTLLTVLYQYYLTAYFCTSCLSSDPATLHVANLSAELLGFFGYNFQSIQDPNDAIRLMIMGNEIISRVNEGCNGISVMIIFVSFVIGLYAKFSQTVFFLIFGLLALIFSNILRIALLNYLILQFPEFTNLAHDIVFPSIIYGMMFLLWLAWVIRFALPYWKNKLIDEKK